MAVRDHYYRIFEALEKAFKILFDRMIIPPSLLLQQALIYR